jgi:hypothetical protein
MPDPRRAVPVPPPRPVASYAPLSLDPKLRAHLTPIGESARTALAGRVFRITDWERWPMERRIGYLHALTEDWSKDPALAALAAQIIRDAGVVARAYREQWAALLKWVQTKILYANEVGERICSPQHTLNIGVGDCDDLGILLASLGNSIHLPWAFTISGLDKNGNKVRWTEGEGPCPTGVTWTHIYLRVGWPPFRPAEWVYAEPTLPVPLGWDCVSAARDRTGRLVLPEMGDAFGVPTNGRGDAGERVAVPLTGANGKGNWRRYAGASGVGTRGRPGATLGIGMPKAFAGSSTALGGPATSPVFGSFAPSVEAAAEGKASPVRVGASVPASRAKNFAASIPWPQVAGTLIAGVLSYVVTQQVIAPRWKARRRR